MAHSAFVVGVNNGVGQPLGLLQPGRHREAADRAVLGVLLPPVPEQVAAHDALEPDRLRRAHEHRPPADLARASRGSRSGRTRSRDSARCSAVWSNQNCDRPVSTRPLSGISSGSTTSNTEMRSLATINSGRARPRTARGPCPNRGAAARSAHSCDVELGVDSIVERVEDTADVRQRALEIEAGVEPARHRARR